MNEAHYFAAATQDADIMTTLGIDWKLLLLQVGAFLVLILVLGKFVYPWLMKQVDERQENIEAAAEAASKAQEAAAGSQAETARLLSEARQAASDIVATAKLEAEQLKNRTEEKARQTAEKIVADAQAQLNKDIEAAKRDLHNETIELIALATEKVVKGTLTKASDKSVISKALADVSKGEK